MIKTTVLNSKDRLGSCDNCNRMMHLFLKYEFFDKGQTKPYVKIHLCEDCSNAMANLHFKCMEKGENYKYDMDEYTLIE